MTKSEDDDYDESLIARVCAAFYVSGRLRVRLVLPLWGRYFLLPNATGQFLKVRISVEEYHRY